MRTLYAASNSPSTRRRPSSGGSRQRLLHTLRDQRQMSVWKETQHSDAELERPPRNRHPRTMAADVVIAKVASPFAVNAWTPQPSVPPTNTAHLVANDLCVRVSIDEVEKLGRLGRRVEGDRHGLKAAPRVDPFPVGAGRPILLGVREFATALVFSIAPTHAATLAAGVSADADGVQGRDERRDVAIDAAPDSVEVQNLRLVAHVRRVRPCPSRRPLPTMSERSSSRPCTSS